MRLRRAVACLTLFVVAGCSSGADYDERMNFLRKVAQRGADTHTLISSQEGVIDKDRCERAFKGIDAFDDAPEVDNVGDGVKDWHDQVREFFVDSCVSGKPRAVPGDPALLTPSSSGSAQSGSAVSPSASR